MHQQFNNWLKRTNEYWREETKKRKYEDLEDIFLEDTCKPEDFLDSQTKDKMMIASEQERTCWWCSRCGIFNRYLRYFLYLLFHPFLSCFYKYQ